MPGKPFRSSLEPHFEEIAQRRMRRETWAEIATELEKAHGVKVHFTAVQKFFGRHLAGRPRPLGFAPLPASPSPVGATPAAPLDHAATDPLNFDAQGQPVPGYHPDDENPFKLRKRQAQRAALDGGEATAPAAPQTPPAKKYVFIPKEKRPSRFSDEDLEFNDPLA